MKSLLRYLINNFTFLLFIILEVVSLVFVFNYNKYHKVQYLNSSNWATASVYNSFKSVIQYFELAKVNQGLAEENAKLKSFIQSDLLLEKADSLLAEINQEDSTYRYIPTRIINNSVNKANNYITLNKGRKDGVKPDQGIVSSNGIVGVVTGVSDSYAVGFSVLNKRWGPSGKLKNSGYFGPVEWDGSDYQMADFKEIPFHVKLAVGDTIVTSGYSTFFPEGITIGTIHSFSQPEGESFYKIRIKLSIDFKSIHFVNTIENIEKEEIKELEILLENGEPAN
jgi:rod shape-determining protein MreC